MFSKTDIEKYFNAEKQESLLFIIIGVTGIVIAIVFFFSLKISFYKGAAIPFFFISLLLGIAGFTVYKRSDKDRIRNVFAYDMQVSELKNRELPRMKTVMKNFLIYRYTEITLLLIGGTLYVYFIRDIQHDFWRGFGLALALMAFVALFADYFAEKRSKAYTQGLESFVTKF